METQQLKELILKELPILIQQDSGLREWVLNIGRTQFADKTVTESRFDQMMQVIQQKMEEDRQSREEQARRWEEQARRWEKNQQQLLELERKSDERWKEIQHQWQEDQRKWKENQRKWEENQRKLQEMERKSDQRWEENQRKLQEMERKSDERWEENQRKWEANQQVINDMLASIRKLDNKYEQTLGAISARWGLHSEDTFRNALSGILQQFPSGVEVIHVHAD